MELSLDKMKEILVTPGYLTEKQFEEVAGEANDLKSTFEETLLTKDIISAENLARLIAESTGYRFINLRKVKINEKILNRIPEILARSKQLVAFDRDKEGIKVALRNPDDLEALNIVEKRLGEPVVPYYVTQIDLESVLRKYKSNLKKQLDELLKKIENRFLSDEDKDLLMIDIVNILIRSAYHSQASDLHIEPFRSRILVRLRIDGVMHDFATLKKELHDLIVTRIKILAKLRTDEHRAAQDGKIHFEMDKDFIDIRVSILPVVYGENVVMRILAESGRHLNLSTLGLNEEGFAKIKKVIYNPYGMILTTGPTGSGKTTTLYAVLKILNQRDVHIATIEDPVEYDIEGISQIQVNPRTNLTFAKGLKSILRQDPDIIMIGEIRDPDTANIAVNAAMTGHIVLSSLHTNDSATAIPRLIDMDIDPFLIATTVNIVIAQRLLRKICPVCIKTHLLTKEEKKIMESDERIAKYLQKKNLRKDKLNFYEGKGCEVCDNTGYLGRVGIFEILEITDNIKSLILEKVSSNILADQAIKNGMATMFEDGVDKVLSGLTTFSELLRTA